MSNPGNRRPDLISRIAIIGPMVVMFPLLWLMGGWSFIALLLAMALCAGIFAALVAKDEDGLSDDIPRDPADSPMDSN